MSGGLSPALVGSRLYAALRAAPGREALEHVLDGVVDGFGGIFELFFGQPASAMADSASTALARILVAFIAASVRFL
jgi:hypothetical protein